MSKLFEPITLRSLTVRNRVLTLLCDLTSPRFAEAGHGVLVLGPGVINGS